MTTTTEAPALIVRDMQGNEVKRIPVSTPTQRKVERVVSGMLINMDTSRFYVDDSAFDGLTD